MIGYVLRNSSNKYYTDASDIFDPWCTDLGDATIFNTRDNVYDLLKAASKYNTFNRDQEFVQHLFTFSSHDPYVIEEVIRGV